MTELKDSKVVFLFGVVGTGILIILAFVTAVLLLLAFSKYLFIQIF